MFNIFAADSIWEKIEDLENYPVDEMKLSEDAALRRTNRMRIFLKSISPIIRYPLCCFKN
jgi:hypothetical protein